MRLEDLPEEAWRFVEGKSGESDTSANWSNVAWEYRANVVISQQIANLSYSIKTKGDDSQIVYDSDTDRDNYPAGYEWLNEFNELTQKSVISELQNGASYWCIFRDGKNISHIQWLKCSSVKPEYNRSSDMVTINGRKIQPGGLIGFTRSNGQKDVRISLDDIVYFWPPDPEVEIGPAQATPAKAIKSERDSLFNLNQMFNRFWKSGLIDPFFITYDDNLPQPEAQAIKTFFSKMMQGIKNAFTSNLIRSNVKVQKLGDGLKGLESAEITADLRLSIMAAYGVPETKFVQSAANRATRELDERAFITDTIWPYADWRQSVLNKQLFSPMGLVFSYHVDRLDAMQTEELQGANSFAALVSSGVHPETAAAMLGMEVPEGYTLTGGKDGKEDEESEEQETESLAEEQAEEEAEEPEDDAAEQEMATLRRWIAKRVKAGKSLNGFNPVKLSPFDVYMAIQDAEIKQLQNMTHIDSPMGVRILNRFQDELNRLSRLLSNGSMTRAQFQSEFKALIKRTLQELFAIGTGEDYNSLSQEQKAVIDNMSQEQEDYSGAIALALASGEYEDNPAGLSNRIGLWVSVLGGALFLGRMWGDDNKLLQWRLGGTVEHCTTCSTLNGQTKTAKEWRESGYQPQGSMLECRGFKCQCGLYEV